MRCLLVTTIVTAISVRVAAGVGVSEDVPVPGGRAALAAAFDISPVPDRARFVSEVARLIHGGTFRRASTPVSLAAQLRVASASGGTPDVVPVPLTAEIWSDAIFLRQITRDDLVVAILADRQASLLAYGLAAFDDDTLAYVSEHPAVLTAIYTHASEPFAAFAGSMRVRGGRVVPPGGDESVALWEAVVGERVTRPDRFIPALFMRVQGRIAGLYDTIGQLDEPRQRFALGLWMEPPLRLERFLALAATVSGDGRTNRAQPFTRQPYDLAAALARVRVDAAGRPTEPASLAFWSRAIERAELPVDPGRILAAEPDTRIIDAAWLAELTLTPDMRLRSERLDQFAFGQRVFAGITAAQMPDAFVAIRAVRRYRMLMFTLERMDIRKPETYAAAARVGSRLASPDPARAFVATAQFQGALGLLWRMQSVHTLDPATAERLVDALLTVPLNASGQYLGGVIRWLHEQLRQAIAPGETLDAAIEAAVSGPDNGASAARIQWEGKRYRVDLPAAEAERLRRVREKLGGATLDLAFDLAESARRLSASPAPSPEVVQSSMALLRSVETEYFGNSERDTALETDEFPPGVARPPSPRTPIVKALDELEGNGGTSAARAARAASELADAADEAAAQALVSLTYAIHLGDPEGAALLPGNISRRHDFGFNQRDTDQRLRAAWMTPRQDVSPGVPWHLDGSLLGLDIALAPSALRRLGDDRALVVPTLTSNERETFIVTHALMDPLRLTDDARDAIADGIARGRQRIVHADVRNIAAIAAELHMEGRRRREILWTLLHDRGQLESMISLRELLTLGQGAREIDLDPWGTSSIVWDGCVCTRMPPPGRLPLVLGRHQIGLFSTAIPDLNLHVARMLSDLRLPASLAKYVLSAAVLNFVDEVRATDPDDWLSLVRTAGAVARERIEDYVAAAAADGPLVLEPLK
jgi:hypothetical protein